MHETVFAESLLRMVLEAATNNETPGRKLLVDEICLDVGVLACLEPQTFKGCFELLAEGTAAEKARLTINRRPMTGTCADCKSRVETFKRAFACPLCSGRAVDWQGGNELEISSIMVTPYIKERENSHE